VVWHEKVRKATNAKTSKLKMCYLLYNNDFMFIRGSQERLIMITGLLSLSIIEIRLVEKQAVMPEH